MVVLDADGATREFTASEGATNAWAPVAQATAITADFIFGYLSKEKGATKVWSLARSPQETTAEKKTENRARNYRRHVKFGRIGQSVKSAGLRLGFCAHRQLSLGLPISSPPPETHNHYNTHKIMKMEIGAMALCSLGAATAFVAPSAFHGSQLARPQQATSGEYVMPSFRLKPVCLASLLAYNGPASSVALLLRMPTIRLG